jgi:hypothetical protein
MTTQGKYKHQPMVSTDTRNLARSEPNGPAAESQSAASQLPSHRTPPSTREAGMRKSGTVS